MQQVSDLIHSPLIHMLNLFPSGFNNHYFCVQNTLVCLIFTINHGHKRPKVQLFRKLPAIYPHYMPSQKTSQEKCEPNNTSQHRTDEND